MGLAATVFWSVLSVVQHRIARDGIDLAIYGQAVRQYAGGHLPWSHLKAADGRFNLLGDHFTPIVATLGPVYRLRPHVDVVLIAQAALIGAATAVVVRTARDIGVTPRLAICIGVAFTLSWGVADMALFAFHEVAFALPMLALSMRCAVVGRWQAAVGWSTSLMLVKEDSALLIAGLALACWAGGHRRLAIAAFTYAAGSFALIVGVVIPRLSYSGTYTYWGATSAHQTGTATGILANLQSSFGSGQALLTIGMALAATLLLAVRSPLMWVAVPSLLARFTSWQPSYWGPVYHYNATLMVVVFFAALHALTRPPRLIGTVRGRTTLAVSMLAVAAALTVSTPLTGYTSRTGWSCNAHCQAVHSITDAIPDNASVAASDALVGQLVDRTNLYLFNPTFTDSAGHPFRTQYVVYDTHGYRFADDEGRTADLLHRSGYAHIAGQGGIELYMRK